MIYGRALDISSFAIRFRGWRDRNIGRGAVEEPTLSSFCHRRALGICGGSPKPCFEFINDYSFTAKTAGITSIEKRKENIGQLELNWVGPISDFVDNLKPIIEIYAIYLEFILHKDHPTIASACRPTKAINNHRAINCLIQRLPIFQDKHLQAHSKKLIKIP